MFKTMRVNATRFLLTASVFLLLLGPTLAPPVHADCSGSTSTNCTGT